LSSCFPGMLLRCVLNDFEMVPVALIITGITFVFTFPMRYIATVRPLFFASSQFFLGIFISPNIATSIKRNVYFPLSPIIISSFLLAMVLSVLTC
jgi:hypothetical protein